MRTPTSSIENYQYYIAQTLCWLDGSVTHASSDEQRQCPKCRTKLSYTQISLELKILESFCNGHSASKAALLTGCAKNTALSHYRKFSKHMELGIASRLLDGSIATNPQSIDEVRLLEKALRVGSLKKRVKACFHLFMQSLLLNERMEMIFQACIAPELRAYIQLIAYRLENKTPTRKQTRLAAKAVPFGPFEKTPPTQPTLWERLRQHLVASFVTTETPSQACIQQGEEWVQVWLACQSLIKSQ